MGGTNSLWLPSVLATLALTTLCAASPEPIAMEPIFTGTALAGLCRVAARSTNIREFKAYYADNNDYAQEADRNNYVTPLSDSGCDCIIFRDRKAFSTYKTIPHGSYMINTGSKTQVAAIGIGTVRLSVRTDQGHVLRAPVYHEPQGRGEHGHFRGRHS